MNTEPKNADQRPKLICPECNNKFRKETELTVGKIVECPACVTECEVISISPLKLTPLEEEK